MRSGQALHEQLGCPGRRRRAPQQAHEAARVVEAVRRHGLHLLVLYKDLGVVIGQKSQILARQDQRGDRFLVETGGLAGQPCAVAQFHVGRVIAQAGESVGAHAKSCHTSGFQAVGSAATSDPTKSADGSIWSFRIDPDQPDVMYATWTLKNGKKRLEEVRFKKQKS